jgi:hypothetical protein
VLSVYALRTFGKRAQICRRALALTELVKSPRQKKDHGDHRDADRINGYYRSSDDGSTSSLDVDMLI